LYHLIHPNYDPVETVSVDSLSGADFIDVDGGTLQMQATVYPDTANQKITWSVDNREVAIINSRSGLLTAINDGEVLVKAEAVNGVYGTKTIYISNQSVTDILIESINVFTANGESSLVVGESANVVCNIEPSNATNQNITWESSDEGIITVSPRSGAYTVATAVGAGEATIYGLAEDGSNISGQLTLNVTANRPAVGEVTDLGIEEQTNPNLTLRVGDTNEVKICVIPRGLKPGVDYKSIEAESSNTTVMSVATDTENFELPDGTYINKYVLNALSSGEATITYKAIGLDDTVKATLTVDYIVADLNEFINSMELKFKDDNNNVMTTLDNNQYNVVVSFPSEMLDNFSPNRFKVTSYDSGLNQLESKEYSDMSIGSSSQGMTEYRASENGITLYNNVAHIYVEVYDWAGLLGERRYTIAELGLNAQEVKVTRINLTTDKTEFTSADIGTVITVNCEVVPGNATNKTLTYEIYSSHLGEIVDRYESSFSYKINGVGNQKFVVRANDGSNVYGTLDISVT
jgi:uncharacterized protein YjdB